jgi:hypothetical protein
MKKRTVLTLITIVAAGWTANAEWTEVNALELPDPGSINCLKIGIIL